MDLDYFSELVDTLLLYGGTKRICISSLESAGMLDNSEGELLH
jgi:hypothetical protein